MGNSSKPSTPPAELCMELNNETILDIQFESYVDPDWSYNSYIYIFFMGEKIATISCVFWDAKPKWTFRAYNNRTPLKHYNARSKGLAIKLLNEVEPLIEEGFIEQADKYRGKVLAQKVADELTNLVDREVRITSRNLIGAAAQTTYSPLIELRAKKKGTIRHLVYGNYWREVKVEDIKKLRKTINFIGRHTKAVRKHFEEINNE